MIELTPADVLLVRKAHTVIEQDEERDIIAGLQNKLLTAQADRAMLRVRLDIAESALEETRNLKRVVEDRLVWVSALLILAVGFGLLGWGLWWTA